MFVSVMVMLFVLVLVMVPVRMSGSVRVRMRGWFMMRMGVSMIVRQMNIELYSFDARFFSTSCVQVIAFEPEFLQLMLQFMEIQSQINQRAHKHVAADSAENV